MPHVKPPHVAVLVDTATGWGRSLIRGVLSYAHTHGPWHLWIEQYGQTQTMRLPPGWSGGGVIARVSDYAMARRLAEAAVPVVNISNVSLRGVDLPRVAADLGANGRLAGEYFLDHGLRHCAYFGLLRPDYVKRHYEGFLETVTKAGGSCAVYRPGPPARKGWDERQKDLIGWLKSLPKPCGVFAWDSEDGRRVVEACRLGGLIVPEQVAVLAGENDELLCEACSPPLSGVNTAADRVGHDAAALLDKLMRGRRRPKRPIFVQPQGIASRQSTEILAIEDQDVVQAIRFIRERAAVPIRVEDVLRAVPLSRRRLEIRFLETLGRSPAAEIRRVHLERAKQLLAESHMPIPKVAVTSGFGSPEYLAYVVKSSTGLTPLRYRNRAQLR